MAPAQTLSPAQQQGLLQVLQARFAQNPHRHPGLTWEQAAARLLAHPAKLWSLHQMEATGGEPDVVGLAPQAGTLVFFDCAAESPAGRRSLCFDPAALAGRKDNPPANSALGLAQALGIELLTEAQYRQLQTLGEFDLKTSSWIATPPDIRQRGGALFADRRYGHVFVYHNGAQSYYAARGFRGSLQV
ncbi:MAG: DUF4256 domain-containing protein [Bernardetiaceae bacterium]|jgi:hypothetical protein|nr:DUF4256 domain-containing protein [Bernardetiaceae bacterium]